MNFKKVLTAIVSRAGLKSKSLREGPKLYIANYFKVSRAYV